MSEGQSRRPAPGRGEGVQRWVAAADVATVALALLALEILLFRGFRIEPGGVVLSATNAVRPFLGAVLIALVRHAIVRRPSLRARLSHLVGRIRWPPAVSAIVWPFAVSRVAVLFVGITAVYAIGFQQAAPWRASEDEILNLLARFDAGWYWTIAENGYSIGGPGHSDVAFFPLYPMMMAGLGRMLGGHPLVAGFLISLGAFLGALAYVYQLALLWCARAENAGPAVVLLAFYPFALFFGLVYTESLFLLCAAGAIYHIVRGQTGWSAVLAFSAGLTRPNGFLLALPLAVLAVAGELRAGSPARRWLLGGRLSREAGGTGLARGLVPALASVAAMLAYSAYTYSHTGHPLAWAFAQGAWGRGYLGLLTLVTGPYASLQIEGLAGVLRRWPIESFNALAGLFAIAGLWPVARRYGLGLAAFVAVNLLPPMLFGGTVALGRYTSVLFPLFFWLADVVPPERRQYWIAAFGMGQGLAACLFFTWRPLF